MKYRHSLNLHGVVVAAARRFMARRRITRRRHAWRPITLFWRQKRKALESLRARQAVLKAGAVSLAQFHLHFMISENGGVLRHSTHRLVPVAAGADKRVVMKNEKTIIQSRMDLAESHRAQSTIKLSSRSFMLSDSGAKPRTTAQGPHSVHKPISPVPTAWRAVRAQFANLERNRVHVPLGKRIIRGDQTFRSGSTSTIEQPLFRIRSALLRYLVPSRSREGTPAQLFFQTQDLVWRRAPQSGVVNADNLQKWDLAAREEQPHGRSLTGKDVAFGKSPSAGSAPATPAIKIDSAMIDRLTDDVIRRVERRARIERARQGL